MYFNACFSQLEPKPLSGGQTKIHVQLSLIYGLRYWSQVTGKNMDHQQNPHAASGWRLGLGRKRNPGQPGTW